MTAQPLRLVLAPPDADVPSDATPSFSRAVAALAAAVRCVEIAAKSRPLSAEEARRMLREHLRRHAERHID